MENFNYLTLDSTLMKEEIQSQGKVEVYLPEKRYAVFYKFANKLDKLLLKKTELSKLHAVFSFLLGIFSLLRILIFHSRLMELISFYYLTNPMLSVEKSSDEKDTVKVTFSR